MKSEPHFHCIIRMIFCNYNLVGQKKAKVVILFLIVYLLVNGDLWWLHTNFTIATILNAAVLLNGIMFEWVDKMAIE